ncbi:MAG: DNA polymerase III subunit delta' [Nevskiaceae bacterium]|nr:MAG: DNA polymerase III subunit delta' [Nevskiaceae bacterium]
MSDLFKPLPWQAALWGRMTALITEGRLAHALLLAGPQGVGKRHFARALTSFLLCEKRDAYACGQCRSCLQLSAGQHPNAFLLQREVDEKTGKQKRDIAIEQVRDLGERLTLSSHYGQAKVAVIDPADALNHNGVNALLKTIEEPPPASYLILISERPQALLPTLRSRCQRVRMAVPDAASAMTWLGEGKNERDALEQAHGAPLRARALIESGELERRRLWASEMAAIAAQKRDPLAFAGAIGKDDATVFLEWLPDWLTQQLRQQARLDAAQLRGLEQMIQETFGALQRLRSNANPQLQVEALLILWWRISRPARAA